MLHARGSSANLFSDHRRGLSVCGSEQGRRCGAERVIRAWAEKNAWGKCAESRAGFGAVDSQKWLERLRLHFWRTGRRAWIIGVWGLLRRNLVKGQAESGINHEGHRATEHTERSRSQGIWGQKGRSTKGNKANEGKRAMESWDSSKSRVLGGRILVFEELSRGGCRRIYVLLYTICGTVVKTGNRSKFQV